ncbi:MAG TPA: hypothetical protein VMU75_11950 [Acidimicrobiales bacterium]|nr:hypothetical protein [Acidimicrobiales bacterium]
MSIERGWVSYAGGQENSHLTADERRNFEQRIATRRSERGRLLARVEVEVFEHGAEAQVSFPEDAILGPESDAKVIAEAVSRARAELEHWR